MEALFVFGVLLIMIIKHVGACAKEGYEFSSNKQKAVSKGESSFYVSGHEYDTTTGHRVSRLNDGYLGWSTTDVVTGQKRYHELEQLMEKFEREKDNPKYIFPDEEDVWQGRLNGRTVYVDRKTKQVLYLCCADTAHDNNRRVLDKDPTYFYVEYNDRSKFVRKTKKQIRLQMESSLYKNSYSKDEIENYVATSEEYRDKNGNWKPVNYDRR